VQNAQAENSFGPFEATTGHGNQREVRGYRAYIYAGGKLLAERTPDGNLYWLHTNHLGNSSRMTDQNGTMVYRGEFDPYGNLVYEWGLAGLNTRKFTGYERDSNTGLDYANARMYGAGRGRFIQPDPIGLKAVDPKRPQSLNRYAYALNDPVNITDVSGTLASIIEYGDCRIFVSWTYFEWGYWMNWSSMCPSGGGGGSSVGSNGYDEGGGGDPLGFIKNAAKDLAKKKLDNKNCQNDLAALGVTVDQVIAGAESANIMNGVGSTVTLSSLYANSPDPNIQKIANTITGTVGDKLATPGAVAVAQLGGPAIYVDPAKFNVSAYWQNISIVLHEVLHNVTGLTDPDIQRKLGLDENQPSDNITKKLKKDCF
jgi:RHS repeat-associated protein